MFSLVWIMPPRVMTQSVGRLAAASRGGGTGGQVGGQGSKVGKQGSNQGDNRNQSGTAVNDNIRGDVRNVIVNNVRRGSTYKEFLACNHKEYDGKGGAVIHTLGREVVVGMSWDNFKVLMREEFCPSNEMQKLETEL
ncbi:hypothetical protein Tco_1499130 [Tanacetum coccineum]